MQDVATCLSMTEIVLMTFALLDDDLTHTRIRFAIDQPNHYISAVSESRRSEIPIALTTCISKIVHRFIATEDRHPISEFFELLQLEQVR